MHSKLRLVILSTLIAGHFNPEDVMVRIAMIVGEGFEDSEFSVPFERLSGAGHEITVVGSKRGETLTGKRGNSRALIEQTADNVQVGDFDALVIPGGQGPDHLRLDADIVKLTRAFVESGKPVAAICHGLQLLIEADKVRGRTLTSWPSVRTDLINAGAEWVDQPVVEDGNLITSRKPDDLDAFCNALLQRLRDSSGQAA